MSEFACRHPKTEANTYWSKQDGGVYAKCKTCHDARNEARRRQRQAEAAALRPPKPTESQRFWSKVSEPLGPKGCRCWMAATDRRRRGVFNIALDDRPGKWIGLTTQAHVIAWEYTNGPVPPGLHLHHVCENGDGHLTIVGGKHRPCVDPDHLTLLTKDEHDREHGKLGSICRFGHQRYRQPNGRWRCPVCKR